jgi:hypothetical protein
LVSVAAFLSTLVLLPLLLIFSSCFILLLTRYLSTYTSLLTLLELTLPGSISYTPPSSQVSYQVVPRSIHSRCTIHSFNTHHNHCNHLFTRHTERSCHSFATASVRRGLPSPFWSPAPRHNNNATTRMEHLRQIHHVATVQAGLPAVRPTHFVSTTDSAFELESSAEEVAPTRIGGVKHVPAIVEKVCDAASSRNRST